MFITAPRWRRDLLFTLLGALASLLLTAPLAWAALRHERDLAQRNLIDDATRAALDFGLAQDNSAAEVFSVETDAIAPEVPQGAHLLIDKKSPPRAAGDVVVFRVGDRTFLGRVVAIQTDGFVIGRNGELDRVVRANDVIGRGVLNTR
jgi:hypothetical protein